MTDSPFPDHITIETIREAARRLQGRVLHTPLLESSQLNRVMRCRVLLKAESLQYTGSFKFRGAFNFLSLLSHEQQRKGVVTYSSGNHAQGVAEAARIIGTHATVVMPSDAPQTKVQRTRDLGAEVILCGESPEERRAKAQQIAGKTGCAVVPPFDHPFIIAGQGTAGLEIADTLANTGIAPDIVVIPCGGGGLAAGVGTALVNAWSAISVFASEPLGYDSTRRSIAAGQSIPNDDSTTTICDALKSSAGELTLGINRRFLAGGVSVDDHDIRNAMRVAFQEFNLVLEPGGAAALAAVLSRKVSLRNKTVIVLATGGNVDRSTFISAISHRRWKTDPLTPR